MYTRIIQSKEKGKKKKKKIGSESIYLIRLDWEMPRLEKYISCLESAQYKVRYRVGKGTSCPTVIMQGVGKDRIYGR